MEVICRVVFETGHKLVLNYGFSKFLTKKIVLISHISRTFFPNGNKTSGQLVRQQFGHRTIPFLKRLDPFRHKGKRKDVLHEVCLAELSDNELIVPGKLFQGSLCKKLYVLEAFRIALHSSPLITIK